MRLEKKLGEQASKYFNGGYNCAQSVLLTMFEHWGGKDELIPKIASGFGGGIGSCGSLCGAFTGGVMALSVRYGSNESSAEKRKKVSKIVQKFYKQFETQNKSVFCRELIGYNLLDPKELAEAKKKKVFEEKCTIFVRKAVEGVLELSETRTC